MCMFPHAINTSSIQLVAATVIALRVAAGSKDPTSIIGPTLVATIIGTVFAVICCKFMEKLPMFRIDPEVEAREEAEKKLLMGVLHNGRIYLVYKSSIYLDNSSDVFGCNLWDV